MPFYDYRCSNPECNKIIEILRKMTDGEGEVICPCCESIMNRIYNPATDIWKTDGAYSKINHGGN
jgi:putative FmdB family regulatory protein